MPQWNPEEINEKSESDFKSAWIDTADLIQREGKAFRPASIRGSAHPIEVARQRIRRVLLGLGFDEVITPLIWEDEHVRKQYGPESTVILDRCYYLAGLPRPEIGLSKKKMGQIRKIVPGFSSFDKLTELLRDYKAGKIESDDFIEEMMNRLNITEEKATEIIDKVFAEMRKLNPVATNLTLLSHFTTAWFPILAEVINKKVEPVLLFTTGVRMRREQREDATHLRSHYNASIVVMAKNFTLEDGRSIVKKILHRLGFHNVKFVTKEATSNYYAPGTEEEVFAKHPLLGGNAEGIEIADLGMYSPVALARYGIPYPVFNMGLSIGRLAMISEEVEDIRKLTYPEIYLEAEFSDDQIMRSLRPLATPITKQGRTISEKIVEIAKRRADSVAPCKFKVWEGRIGRRHVLVELVEREEGVKLIGPAAFNIIQSRDGNIVSVTPEKGRRISGHLTYIKSVADYCASQVEDYVRQGTRGTRQVRIGMVRAASDIYLDIPKAIRRYVESNNKKIDIRGPMFTTIQYTIG